MKKCLKKLIIISFFFLFTLTILFAKIGIGDFMFDESGGEAKGSLKNRLKVLYANLRIARKKKIKAELKNVNKEKLEKAKKITPFFYFPIKMVVPENLKSNNIILYDGVINENDYALRKDKKKTTVDVEISKTRNFKKGIVPLEDIIANNRETNTFPIVDDLPSKDAVIDYIESNAISEDEINAYGDKYGVSPMTPDTIYDILMIKYYSDVLFDEELTKEEINDFIQIRVGVDSYMRILNELATVEKTLLEREEEISKPGVNPTEEVQRGIINDGLALSKRQVAALEEMLLKQNESVTNLLKEITIFNEKTVVNTKLVGLGSSVQDILGIGLGLLTLPFSRSRTFSLGTNLIRNSVTNIKKNVKTEKEEHVVREYKITENDIKTADDGVRTATFLLDDAFDHLSDVKFRIRYYRNILPDADKMLRQIELLEKALIKRRIKLKQIEESLQKSKVKVLKRAI